MPDGSLATIRQNRVSKDGQSADYSAATEFLVPTVSIGDNTKAAASTEFVVAEIAVSAPVLSVFGRVGAVVALTSDYDASQVDNDSGVVGATVADALDTLAATGSGDMESSVYDPAGITEQLIGLTATQTMTNKTLTSPSITDPTGIVKGDVGLGNVDNVADASQTALGTLVSGNVDAAITAAAVLPDGVAATTQTQADNSTKVATTAYVDAAVSPENLWNRVSTNLVPNTAGDDIGSTGTRINKIWATDLQVTNAIAGSITGNAATVSTIAGLAPNTATTQATQPNITSAAALVTIGTIGTGVWEGTDVGVAHGGTGSSTAGGARTNLGLVIGTDVQAWDAVLDATTASFLVADETKLDGIEPLAEVNTVDSVNTQTGVVVLDADDISDAATTNKFTTAGDISKLAGIASGAQVNTVDSVNTQTGAVVLDADDVSDAATTNKYTTAGDITKLLGIEALADVTDATNVNAAGATMNADTTLVGNGYFLDEDNMISDDATKVASQQSIKKFVEDQIATVNSLAEVLALGNTTGGTDIAVSGGDDIVFSGLTSGIITLRSTAIAGASILTLPAATDTLVGKATTDTFTNKSGDISQWTNDSGYLTSVDLTSDVTGTLPVANGGTGVTSSTGSGSNVLSTSPTLVTPALGTPSALVGTNISGTASALSIGGNSATVSTITGLAPDTATTQAAQPNITSLGTLTALQVDNININLNTISSTAGTDLFITPLAGQQLILDGAIVIDAGVVTGATSITSTDFVGALTGNADTVTTNANLTGEVVSTGNAASIDVTAISNQSLVTGVAGDFVLIEDATDGTLKKVNVGDFIGGGGADTSLSNLVSVAINTTLVSDTDNTDALGTAAIAWSDLFLGNLSVITWSTAPSTADVTLTHAANSLTFAGGTIALGTATATGGITGDLTGNADTVTTNANLTGPITSVGNATSIASQTGTGTTFVMNTSPTLVTPVLGTPSSGSLGSCVDYEGTAVASTGEAGGTKFLREDGDGTCSWQEASGGGGGGSTDINAGENVDAGDALRIKLDGLVYQALKDQQIGNLQQLAIADPLEGKDYACVSIDTNKVIYIFYGISTGRISGIVATWDGENYTIGGATTILSAGAAGFLDVTKTATDKFTVFFFDNTGADASVKVCTVIGTAITIGSTVDVETGPQTTNSIHRITSSDTNVITCSWMNDSTSDRAYTRTATVSTRTPSFGTEVELSSDTNSGDNIDVTEIGAAKVVNVYQDTNRDLVAKVSTISGNSMAQGLEVILHSGITLKNPRVSKVLDDKFVVVYTDTDATPDEFYLVVCTVDGTVITPGTPVAIATQFNTSFDEAFVEYFSDNKVALLYPSDNYPLKDGSRFAYTAAWITTNGTVPTIHDIGLIGAEFEKAGDPMDSGKYGIAILNSDTWQVMSNESTTFDMYTSNISDNVFVGFADSTITSGNPVQVNHIEDSNQSSLSAGSKYYLDAAGAISTTGSVPAGTAVTTTKIIR